MRVFQWWFLFTNQIKLYVSWRMRSRKQWKNPIVIVCVCARRSMLMYRECYSHYWITIEYRHTKRISLIVPEYSSFVSFHIIIFKLNICFVASHTHNNTIAAVVCFFSFDSIITPFVHPFSFTQRLRLFHNSHTDGRQTEFLMFFVYFCSSKRK